VVHAWERAGSKRIKFLLIQIVSMMKYICISGESRGAHEQDGCKDTDRGFERAAGPSDAKGAGRARAAYAAYDYPEIDITQPQAVRELIAAVKPRAVVNCAAYTNVDKAESDEEAAYRVNALGPKHLAQACGDLDIELVHISTDYVFSGDPIIENGAPRQYIEEDVCAPATAYGRTKLAGERFVQGGCGKWYILRTAWLYGDGGNFVRTMLRLAETSDMLRVVDDQIGSPTSTADLAEAIPALIGSGAYGLYHATCEGRCSWYEFAKKIFALRGRDMRVVPVTSAEYPRPAPRPKWSVLENAHLKRAGWNTFRPWEDALEEYLRNE
jgi:dTDP-4-dehydrorhamnose reductase